MAPPARKTTRTRRVAIACQGGGSHTAFTAGVLRRVFSADEFGRYQVVGLSGTSGGAVCALLAWYGLIDDDPIRAGELLRQFWIDNSARGPAEMLVNSWILWAGRLQNYGVLPAVSPYHTPVSVAGAEQFRQLLRRHVDFDRIEVDRRVELPALLLGAVDVLSGRFRAFNSRHDRITVDTVLASAAIPNLFRAVPLDGALYWDGLFSQNPPVRELLDLDPDELWVIQINPQQRATEPTTLLEIADRRNELAGNLSLYQELAFIEKIDRLLESGLLNPGGKYKQVAVRMIELSRSSLPRHLGAESKLNRDPLFIRNLMAHGEDKAEEFLSALAFERAWISQDVAAVMDLFAEDAELISAAPFPDRGSHLGSHAVRRFVEKHLATGVWVDSTRKQVARDRVTWTVRVHDPGEGTSLPGQVDAGFRAGKITDLRLGALPTAS